MMSTYPYASLLLIVLTLLAGCDQATTDTTHSLESYSSDNSAADLFKKFSPVTATIENYREDGHMAGSGTGFFISNEGYIVTNHHVTEYAAELKVRSDKNEYLDVVEIIAQSADLDITILRVSGSGYPHIALAKTKAEVGDDILIIGNPLGLEKTLSDGIVTGYRKVPITNKGRAISTVQVNAAISPGSSGSPVINMDGCAIGIVSFALRDAQNLNFAIDAKHISELLISGEGKQAISDFYTTQSRQANTAVKISTGPDNPNNPKEEDGPIAVTDEIRQRVIFNGRQSNIESWTTCIDYSSRPDQLTVTKHYYNATYRISIQNLGDTTIQALKGSIAVKDIFGQKVPIDDSSTDFTWVTPIDPGQIKTKNIYIRGLAERFVEEGDSKLFKFEITLDKVIN